MISEKYKYSIITAMVVGLSGCASIAQYGENICKKHCVSGFGYGTDGYEKCMSVKNAYGIRLPIMCQIYASKHANCNSYGFSKGTTEYSNCLMNESIARRASSQRASSQEGVTQRQLNKALKDQAREIQWQREQHDLIHNWKPLKR
jgi:hypothetical protein